MTNPYASDAPWGCDVPISMPEPLEEPNTERVSLGGSGMIFTPMGLRFDMSEEDREAWFSAPYRPKGDLGG